MRENRSINHLYIVAKRKISENVSLFEYLQKIAILTILVVLISC